MRKIAILTTDTLHHRFFINKLEQKGFQISNYILETTSVQSPFGQKSQFVDEQLKFENENFFSNLSKELNEEKIIRVKTINDSHSLESLEHHEFDFGIVFGTRKLSPQVIRQFSDNLINVHRGRAEIYRGLDSDLWAFYHGDFNAAGVTIHKVENKLDTGDIFQQEYLCLKPEMKSWQLRYFTTKIAVKLVANALENYLGGRLTFYPQATKGRYYSFMPPDLEQVALEKFARYLEGLK